MAEAALLPRPTALATQTSVPLSLARQHQLIEAMEAAWDRFIGRGIFDNSAEAGSSGIVTKTAAYSVEVEAGTEIADSGYLHTLLVAAPYTASHVGDVWLWGIVERAAANPNNPTDLDTYTFRITHTTTSARPAEVGIDASRWIPLAEWTADGVGIIEPIDNAPADKYITDVAGALSDLADFMAEVIAARGSMGSLDARLDVSLNEDGTLKSNTISFKAPVRLATTANHALSGLTDIDGVTPIAGDRILVKNQTAGAENGIYVAAAGAWARATDCDASAEVKAGLTVLVEEGDTKSDTAWLLVTNNAIVLGTTALVFGEIAAVRHEETFTLQFADLPVAEIVQYRCDFSARGTFLTDYMVKATPDGEGVRVALLDSNREPGNFDFQIQVATDAEAGSYGAYDDVEIIFVLTGWQWVVGGTPGATPTLVLDTHTWGDGGGGGVPSGAAGGDLNGTYPNPQVDGIHGKSIPSPVAGDDGSALTYDHANGDMNWTPIATAASVTAVQTNLSNHEAAADPHTQYQKESEKGAANGYAPLGADSKVPAANLPAGGANGVELIYSQETIESGDTIANTTTLTDFASFGTIPLSTLQVGDVIEYEAWGTYQADGAPDTLLLELVGTFSLFGLGTIALQVAASGSLWRIRGRIIIISIGAAGTFEGTAEAFLKHDSGFLNFMAGPAGGAPGDIDTTADNDLVLKVQWSDASATNTITLRGSLIRKNRVI